MKTDVTMTTTTAPVDRRTLIIAAVSALLALSLAAGLTILTGVLSHATATEAHPSASGFATQDVGGAHSWAASGQAIRASVERCAGMAGKYHFDRSELDYGPGGGSAVTAGGRIYDYLVTEDDDEYAPWSCRMPTS
jgi:hypothetical protein